MWRFALQRLPCLAFAPSSMLPLPVGSLMQFTVATCRLRSNPLLSSARCLRLRRAESCASRPPLSSRLLSEYLGLKTMLAIVCKTYEGVKALEKHDNEGMIDKNAGLYGLGPPIGRLLNGRFLVLCLEKLRFLGNHQIFYSLCKLLCSNAIVHVKLSALAHVSVKLHDLDLTEIVA
uniref:Uncharacterized protein n=1 Tax=Ananas comosus var. bracteatus TaxID=296719 RepID=A0A6V7PY51_ANACO|nr:unnamed protein product [Ananas comosus var. bracteatus]